MKAPTSYYFCSAKQITPQKGMKTRRFLQRNLFLSMSSFSKNVSRAHFFFQGGLASFRHSSLVACCNIRSETFYITCTFGTSKNQRQYCLCSPFFIFQPASGIIRANASDTLASCPSIQLIYESLGAPCSQALARTHPRGVVPCFFILAPFNVHFSTVSFLVISDAFVT